MDFLLLFLPKPRWTKGSCKLGRVCTFAHGETELTAWNNHLEKMDSELKTRKVKQKNVDSAEESKVSSLVEVERPTPTYKVMAIVISIYRCIYRQNKKVYANNEFTAEGPKDAVSPREFINYK